MLIINNRTFDNHESILKANFKESDEAIIISPFLSKSFNFFRFTKYKQLKKITLITTLKNDYSDQVNKINFFKNLFEFGTEESIEIEILIDNSLHGKIYVFKKDNEFKNAIITSANFTSNGLKLNNEWGIALEDKIKIEKIAKDLISNIVLEPITETILKKMETKLKLKPLLIQTVISTVNLVDDLKIKTNPLDLSIKSTFWLKPIGSSENQIKTSEKFSKYKHDLFFAKNPVSIKIGDILIAYTVGQKKILSIFRVKSKVKTTSNPEDRWHFYIEGENLTRFYGNEWNKYNYHISNERDIFIDKTKLKATPSGLNSYGSLQQGADKLKITKEFGNYLVNKIVKINKDISFREENI